MLYLNVSSSLLLQYDYRKYQNFSFSLVHMNKKRAFSGQRKTTGKHMAVTSWWQDEIFVQSEWKLYSVTEVWYSCSDRVTDLSWKWFYPPVVEDNHYLFTLYSRSVYLSACSGSQRNYSHCIHWQCSFATVICNTCQHLDVCVSSQTLCILLWQSDDRNNVTCMHCRLQKMDSFGHKNVCKKSFSYNS
jgi:hypothetical protein